MLKQKGKIIPLGINYSEALKQELDTVKEKGGVNPPAKREEDEEFTMEDNFKGMMSLF